MKKRLQHQTSNVWAAASLSFWLQSLRLWYKCVPYPSDFVHFVTPFSSLYTPRNLVQQAEITVTHHL